MCRETNCIIAGDACRCCCSCYCNYKCYECYDAKANFETLLCDPVHYFDYSSFNVRNKFVCFPCKRVWKSYTNKYAAQKIYHKYGDETSDILKYYNLTKDFSKENCEKVKWNYLDAYFNMSSCANCGQEGLRVGRNFRPCKTNKEWTTLEQQVKNKEINLELDFVDYPREKLNEENLLDKYYLKNPKERRGSLKNNSWKLPKKYVS